MTKASRIGKMCTEPYETATSEDRRPNVPGTMAYVSASEFPSDAANSVQVIRQSNGMAQVGTSVLLLGKCSRSRPSEPWRVRADYGIQAGVDLQLMPVAGWMPRAVASILFPLWSAGKVPGNLEVVYCRHVLGMLFVGLIRQPERMIYECHGPPNMLEAAALRLLCLLGGLHRVVAISSALKRILLEEYAFLRKVEMLVAHDGCDPSPELEVGEAALSVGYVGGFYNGRGLDLVVRLAERMPDVQFHVIGGDRAALERCAGLAIPPNLVCHGRVAPANLGAYYKQFSVALAPYARSVEVPHGADTSSYMSPLKIFEYMGWGKAIVASDLPVLREVLRDGSNALLAMPEDVDSWERALIRLRDGRLRFELARRAREDAEKDHTWMARAKFILGKPLAGRRAD